MPKEHEVTKFRTDVALREKSSDSMFSDKLRFIYLSLPFFDKSEEECETGFEKWIYVLKYMEVLERLPFTAQKKIFNHLAKLADVRCLSSEEQEKSMKVLRLLMITTPAFMARMLKARKRELLKVVQKVNCLKV